jgi:hypothetical protein
MQICIDLMNDLSILNASAHDGKRVGLDDGPCERNGVWRS